MNNTASAMLSVFEMLLVAREEGKIQNEEIISVYDEPEEPIQEPLLFPDEISAILRMVGQHADIRAIDNRYGISIKIKRHTHQGIVNGIYNALESGYTVTINGIDIMEL